MLRWYKRNRFMLIGSFLGLVLWSLIGFGLLIGIVLVIVLGIVGRAVDKARSAD